MKMAGTKKWHESTTIWAGYATMAVGLLGTFGIVIDIDEAQIQEMVGAVIIIITGLASVRGRYKASARIQ